MAKTSEGRSQCWAAVPLDISLWTSRLASLRSASFSLETLGQPSPGQHKFSLKDASLEISLAVLQEDMKKKIEKPTVRGLSSLGLGKRAPGRYQRLDLFIKGQTLNAGANKRSSRLSLRSPNF